MNNVRFFAVSLTLMLLCCLSPTYAANPFLPLWEYIPDGEPYVFEDPDRPGHYRVYLYGSHDSMRSGYCGRELVVWSASVDSLNTWRYDGIIFESKTDRDGRKLNGDGQGDVLYAPDVAEVIGKDGRKTYYLYPNNQAGGRQTMVARSDRPDGPFVVCNWSADDARTTVGTFGFDPAAFVDDDGRAYGYWGFDRSYAAELDPATMASPKPGTKVIEDLIPSRKQDGEFRFFEASSIRKIEDKYVFVYSRWTAHGEFGLGSSNYTLAYAYADNPLGPYTYGGTIIDGRGRDTNASGDTIATATPGGNTHGSIIKIKDRWYVFYHRQTGTDEFSRQAMVAPITVKVKKGKGGKVSISEGEYTSEGFELNGLNPLKRHSAGIACYYTGPRPGRHAWPDKIFTGSYVAPMYADGLIRNDASGRPLIPHYDLRISSNPVVNNTDGSIVGYKYFNFDELHRIKYPALSVNLTPQGVDATIDIYIDSPWEAKGGRKIGSIQLRKNSAQTMKEYLARLSGVESLYGKHALFFVFSSTEKDRSICTLYDFKFIDMGQSFSKKEWSAPKDYIPASKKNNASE